MAYYGVIFPQFWTGHTGRAIRDRGGKDAQLLALYLISNRFSNMLGLYRVLIADIRHEVGVPVKATARAFEVLDDVGYATFDNETAYVWVRQMARFRLGLRSGETIALGDNRILAVNRLYHALDPNPFLGEFYDVNHKLFRLKRRRESVGVVVPLTDTTTSGTLQGASKPLISQVQRSGTGTGIRQQGSGSGSGKSSGRKIRDVRSGSASNDRKKQSALRTSPTPETLQALIDEAIHLEGRAGVPQRIIEAVQSLCAIRQLPPFTKQEILTAVEAARTHAHG